MSKKYRPKCGICGKYRDEITGQCPTPAACDKLRAPAQRLKNEARATRVRLQAARVEHESIGLSRVRAVSSSDVAMGSMKPGETARTAAQRRARTGWRTRRQAGG